MMISEIKKWAKGRGYTIIKEKGSDDEDKPTQYYWCYDNDVNVTGVAPSVSKVAKAIYNHITENKWVEHQEQFQEKKEITKAQLSDY